MAAPPAGFVTELVAGPDALLAFTGDPSSTDPTVAWRSTDGSSWTRAFTFAKGDRVTAGTWTASGFVVGGSSPARAGAEVWTSRDGVTWAPVDDQASLRIDWAKDLPSGGGDMSIDSIVATRWGFVAAGEIDCSCGPAGTAAFWRSSDGRTWTRVARSTTFAAAPPGGAVTAAAGAVVAPAPDGSVWLSATGRTWERVHVTDGVRGLGVVTSLGDRVMLVLDGSTADDAVWSSPDGGSWTSIPQVTAPLSAPVVALSVDDRLVVFTRDLSSGGRGQAWRSDDGGRSWSEVTPVGMGASVHAATWRGRLVVITESGTGGRGWLGTLP